MTKEELKEIRESFFKTTFVLLGHIANCDGYVNRNELKRTRNYMEKMKLSAYCKQQAIKLFRTGSSPQFNMQDTLEEFREAAAKSPSIIEVLLVYLISVARVDGLLVDKEIKLVRKVASTLGYSSIIFEHMLRMITAQEIFEDSQGNNYNSEDSTKNSTENKSYSSEKKPQSTNGNVNLQSAYEALGIEAGTNKSEVKKAYRKLVNQYHPDKVQGQGLPPEFINAATEYFKRIQIAFEYIRSL